MTETIFVRGAKQMLTMHGGSGPRRGLALQDLGIIRDGAMLISGGRIVEVGTTRRVENLALAHAARDFDATGRVVMPGFVDCHTRLIRQMSLDEGAGEIGDGTAGTLRNVSMMRLEGRARHVIHGMIRHGTTALGAELGFGFDQKTELKILRAHCRLQGAPLDVAAMYFLPEGLAEASHSLLAAVQRRAPECFVGVRCRDGDVDREQCSTLLAAVRRLRLQAKIHCAADLTRETVQLAVSAGATSLDYPGGAGTEGIDLLAHSDTIAVLLPDPYSCHANGCGPGARRLIDAGAAVALGSGFGSSISSSYSMQTIVWMACARLRMTPEEALCAATVNAAHAIGAGHHTGTLETGKSADFIVLNVPDYREIHQHFGVNLVRTTVKRGATIYQEGAVLK